MAIDISRETTNVINDPDVSQEIWSKTLDASFFMQHARRVVLPGNGVSIQTITGEPTADWVAETEAKPISRHTFDKKLITPYKLAVIEPYSMEFVRDKRALFDELVRRLPNAIARKFDETILGTTAPGTGFDVLGGSTKVSLTPASGKTVYDQFLAVDAAISAADGVMDTIGLSPAGKSIVQAAVDQMGHPLFTQGVGATTVAPILGAPVYINKHLTVAGTPKTVGVAGDFSDALYGMVSDITLSFSDAATLVDGETVINMWQQNMLAAKVEVEIGFSVQDAAEFVLLTE